MKPNAGYVRVDITDFHQLSDKKQKVYIGIHDKYDFNHLGGMDNMYQAS